MNKLEINTYDLSAVWYHNKDILHIINTLEINAMDFEAPQTVYGIGSSLPIITNNMGRPIITIRTADFNLSIIAPIELTVNNKPVSKELIKNTKFKRVFELED
jgi:hypothetical protein